VLYRIHRIDLHTDVSDVDSKLFGIGKLRVAVWELQVSDSA
jgi:hypothetical protein